MNTLKALERYDRFCYGQVTHIHSVSNDRIVVTLATSDDEGNYNDALQLEFKGVTSSKVFAPHMLAFLDLSEGVTLVFENDQVGFAPGRAESMHYVYNAPFYIVASEVSHKEL